MVWQNRGDNLATMTIEPPEDDPMKRRRSYYDDVWSAETRWNLGLPLFTRLEIPITTKHDMAAHWADLLRGLATKIEHEGKNLGQTEHGAALMMRTFVDHANKEMKSRAKLLKTGRRRKSNEID